MLNCQDRSAGVLRAGNVQVSPPFVSLRGTLPVLLVVAGLMTSCSASKKKSVEPCWTPRPQVSWDRIADAAITLPYDGYEMVMTGPTTGLFPANLAVTRVAISETEEQAGEPVLFADPRNEFLQWNRAFDDQMAISEVFPIDQRDLGGGTADPEQILAAFRALHARVGLIYAVNETSPSESEMFGALYDTQAVTMLAVIHARAQSVIVPDEEKPPTLWETDSRALVRKKFEKYAYDALYSLIRQDQPIRTDPPEGWIPAGPIRPVEWPPRRRDLP